MYRRSLLPISAVALLLFLLAAVGTRSSVAQENEKPPAAAKPLSPKKVFSEPVTGFISVSSDEYKARMDKLAEQLVKLAPEPDGGLLAFILAGIFWGGISLVTPCVFPMIPITVSFFLKQAEKEHHRPVVMASVYSLTIVVVLTLAAAFLLQVFRWLSINPLMNYGLGALFIFFALSLFGMYEIELPSGLARFTSAREGRGGIVGTIFMALTFTIISFACVAPFLGGFGGTAAAARPMWHNLLGGLAFAATFAAPFFVLALFPTLLKALPKSGSWLNSVKVVMGFLELAAAFKFFRGAELIQSGGEVTFFSYDLVLGIWIALAFLSGVYLIGGFRLPHDTPAESIGVPRLLFSATFIGIGLYLAPALFKVNSEGASQRPGGAVYAWVDSFLLPESRAGGTKDRPIIGDLYYAVEKSREHLRQTGQPKRIFVDFTGMVCTNCRINEKDVFPRPDVQRAMQQYLSVELYGDTMPIQLYTPEIQAEIAKDNSRLDADKDANVDFEQKIVDQITLPTYVILEPDLHGKIIVVDVYPEGRISNVPDFLIFLTGARAKEKEQLVQR
jgi:thiol:disulfide interchange protein DsbD